MDNKEIMKIWNAHGKYEQSLSEMENIPVNCWGIEHIRKHTDERIAGEIDENEYNEIVKNTVNRVETAYEEFMKSYEHGVEAIGVIPEGERKPYLSRLEETKEFYIPEIEDAKRKVIGFSKAKSIEDLWKD